MEYDVVTCYMARPIPSWKRDEILELHKEEPELSLVEIGRRCRVSDKTAKKIIAFKEKGGESSTINRPETN
jgi:hypothetical protein